MDSKKKTDKKVMRKLKPGLKKKVMIVAPQTSEKDVKKADMVSTRKLNEVLGQKQRLEQKTERLCDEMKKLKGNLTVSNQEKARMAHFWTATEQKLVAEKQKVADSEKSINLLRTRQTDNVQKLQQKIRTLVFNAKNHKFASTQTESISPAGDQRSEECQTVEELSRQKAQEILRQSDDLLAAFISELEKEKLNAQSDLKYALVQLEQRMKEENEAQERRLREERESEIEEIGLRHVEQLKAMEGIHREETELMEGKISFLQRELENVRDTRDELSRTVEDHRERLADQAADLGSSEAQMEEMKKELTALQEYKREFQRDIRNVENMRKEVKKYKELNEIIMAEFKQLEADRDELLRAVEGGLSQISIENRRRAQKINDSILDSDFSEK